MIGPIPFVFSDISAVRYQVVMPDGSSSAPSADGVSQHDGKYLVDINATITPYAKSLILTDTGDPLNVAVFPLNTNPTADQIAAAVALTLQTQIANAVSSALQNQCVVKQHENIEECRERSCDRMGRVISEEVPR